MSRGQSEEREQGRTTTEARSLEGRTVVVTRPRDQAADLRRPLEARGARVVLLPTIEIVPPADPGPLRRAAARAREYDWIVFTSVNGVGAFARTLRAEGVEPAALRDPSGDDGMAEPARPRICAIGPATGEALEGIGLPPDLIPEEYVAEAVVDALDAAGELEGKRVLQPRAAVARSVLPDGLRARGAEVDVVEAYRALKPERGAGEVRRLLDAGEVDLVTFTASSTVRNFHDMVDPEAGRVRVAAIGPITAGTARELGYDVAVVADEYTVPGLVEACVRWARERAGAA